jgi:hypothetical protein
MRLDLRFLNRPLEDLWCQAVVALVFQELDIIHSTLAGLDVKMGGFLTNLIGKGYLTGAKGERFLVAPQNTIRADKLLFHGLGSCQEYEISILEQGVRELGEVLDKMRVNEFGVAIPIVQGFEKEYLFNLEISVQHLVKPFYENHKDELDFVLKVIFFVEKEFMDYLSPVADRLRDYFTSMLDISVVIDYKNDAPLLANTG